ncbi:MAG: hypothetical protein II956_16700 [Bacteroidales bacterium]|nr:hypothetical protein [Bacteroidales bacterium]
MEIRKRHSTSINNFFAGVGIAIAVPLIVFIFYWYLKFYPSVGLIDLVTDNLKFSQLMQIIAVCALPDPLIFYFLSQKRYDNACKGMLAVIIALLVITIITKFV